MAQVSAPDLKPASSLAARSEAILSLSLLGVLVVLLVPLPPMVLDLLLALNLGLTILLLLVTLAATKPLDFSVFPTVLLLLTLLRLSLNVATTRQILLNGHAGMIVAAFGNVVVGGNLVVGLVVFLILVIIQFVVITKGAGRIAEVAARFTLDALPGKQMAIDAELNAGAIDEAEARRRRSTLIHEAEFHGAMDGASKFVRGDAIAGLVITAVNLVGGIVLGLTRGMEVSTALRTYAVLSVGDGLVSQVPALIVATAAGILVTKATSQTSLGHEISSQVATNPKVLYTAASLLGALALTPGLPKIPFVLLAVGLWMGARRVQQATKIKPSQSKSESPTTKPTTENTLDDFLEVDRVCLEIGARLIPLVDPKRGPGILDRITGLRRDMGKQNGLWVPPIRVRDNIQLEPDAYRFLVGGREVARGSIRPGSWLAIDPGGARLALSGEPVRDPAFGLSAVWITEGDRQRAELAGFTVVDAPGVVITHLGEMLRRHAPDLLGREDLKQLVDKVRETSPSLVDELIPGAVTMGMLHRVLGLLLEERVPISNLTRILESMSHHVPLVKDPLDLTERVRADMGRSICDRFRDSQGRLHSLVLDPRLELDLRRAIHEKQMALDPARLEKLLTRLANEWRKAASKSVEIALLCDTVLRRPLRQVLARSLPDLAVIAYQEVPADILLEPVSLLKVEDLT